MALFWRKVTLDEVLGAVRLELGARRPGEPLPREVVELSRLLRAEEAEFVAGGPPPDPQEIVEGIPDPAGILDPRGRFAVVNKAMDALVGTGRALGRTVLEITRSAELGDAAELASAGTPVRGEYTVGAVAMANAGPDTNGSQFFICIDDCRPKLAKSYNLFGYLIDGIDVAQAVQVGDVMRSVAVTERELD